MMRTDSRIEIAGKIRQELFFRVHSLWRMEGRFCESRIYSAVMVASMTVTRCFALAFHKKGIIDPLIIVIL